MKMLKKFNLDKSVLKIGKKTSTLFSFSNKNYTSENLEILLSKVNRNSQEFQVHYLNYLHTYRTITKI
jgi:hypothetical protein